MKNILQTVPKLIKPTVTVGVSIYNESRNIYNFLTAVLNQKRVNYVLKEIILILDGSDDDTLEHIEKIDSPIIRIVEHKNRRGQQLRQNEILKMFDSDLLIIAEADTLPVTNNLFERLVRPFIHTKNPPDVAFGSYELPKPISTLERILSIGIEAKIESFKEWMKGFNVYYHGGHSIKILQRRFAKNFRWEYDVPEDAYIYLFIVTRNFKYVFIPEAQIIRGSVKSFTDSVRQSSKFIGGIKSLKKYFNPEFIEAEYHIPETLILKHLIKYFINKPIYTILFVVIFISNRFYSSRTRILNPLYEIYTSSKKI